MNNFVDASKLFNTTFKTDDFFESINASFVKSNIIRSVQSDDIPLIFLLGEPGVGKTYMLNMIKKHYFGSKKVLFSSDPFSSAESLLHFLLEGSDFERTSSITELKDKAIALYKKRDSLIIIDEAQLLSDNTLEYIRILSDTGHFKFIVSMHKAEGERILSKKHFLSRPHTVATLERLETNEMLKYIHAQLFRYSLGDLANIFTMKQIKQIDKFSKGNFRMLKQMVKHIFLIMDYAKENGLTSYTKPTKCVITMAAIDLGLLYA
jgi:DNA transposition AAA+ family ATPase